MSSEIKQVYKFLSTINGGWKSAMDQDGNGIVRKSEFSDYMKANYTGWNGESSEVTEAEKNDLINKFWAQIDTTQAGKLSGNISNKNNLDTAEQEKVQYIVDIYNSFDEYKSGEIVAPTGVDNKAWKSAVIDDLSVKVEEYIKNKGPVDGLVEYLDGLKTGIMNQATARETAKQTLSNTVKNYNNGQLDNTLNSLVESFIKKHITNPQEGEGIEDAAAIQDVIDGIVEAYVATTSSDGATEEQKALLAKYGYSINESTGLNELQQDNVKKALTEKLNTLTKETDYKENKDLYDTAINDYIESVLSEAKFSEFSAVQAYGVENFEASEIGVNFRKALTTKSYFGSDDFKADLSNAICEEFSKKAGKPMKGDTGYEAYTSIMEEAIKKAQAGDFDNENKELDMEKVKEWVMEQFTDRISEFYKDNLGEMTLEGLNIVYKQLVESANNHNDADEVREAAKLYTKSLCDISDGFKQIVINEFGEDYEKAIEELDSGEIKSKIEKVMSKVNELGDYRECTISGWNLDSISDSLTLDSDGTSKGRITCGIKNGNGNDVDASRITYSVSTEGSGGTAEIDAVSGDLTIKTESNAAYFSVKVNVLVDGKVVGEPKIIKVQVKVDNMKKQTISGLIATNNVIANEAQQDMDLRSAYNSNASICLSGFTRPWDTARNNAKTNIKYLLDNIKAAYQKDNTVNTTALQAAYDKTLNVYNELIRANNEGFRKADGNTTQTKSMNINGTEYSYNTTQYGSKNDAHKLGGGSTNNSNQVASGLQWNYSADDGDEYYVNIRNVMDMFEQFYKQALGSL